MKAAVITLSIVLVILALTFNTVRVERDTVQTKLENTQDLYVACTSMYDKLKDNTSFERNKDCREQATALRKRWYNIQNGYYNDSTGDCWVTFIDTKTKKMDEGPISGMQDA